MNPDPLIDPEEWEIEYHYPEWPGGVSSIMIMRSKPIWSVRTYEMAVDFAHRCNVLVAVRDYMIDWAHGVILGQKTYRMPTAGEVYDGVD